MRDVARQLIVLTTARLPWWYCTISFFFPLPALLTTWKWEQWQKSVVRKLFQWQISHIKKNQVCVQGLLHPPAAPGGLKEFYYFICVYSLWYLKNTHMNHWQWNVNINLLQVLILLFSSTTFSRPLEIHVYNIMLICIWEFIWFYSISYLLIVLFFFFLKYYCPLEIRTRFFLPLIRICMNIFNTILCSCKQQKKNLSLDQRRQRKLLKCNGLVKVS